MKLQTSLLSVATVALLSLGATALAAPPTTTQQQQSTSQTDPDPNAAQMDKCLDLQTRCLHHEAIVCKVWASECEHPHPSSHGGRRGGGHGFGLVHKRSKR